MRLKPSNLIAIPSYANSKNVCLFLAEVCMLSVYKLIIKNVEAMFNLFKDSNVNFLVGVLDENNNMNTINMSLLQYKSLLF